MSPHARDLIFTDRRAAALRKVRDFALKWWWIAVAIPLLRALWSMR